MISYRPLPIPDVNIPINLTWERYNVKSFAEKYKNWILSSKNSKVIGLEKFQYYLTDGVTGAFSDFEKTYPNLKSVAFRGEYPYHRDTGSKRIEDISDLKNGQKLYISYPFAAHGLIHADFNKILNTCEVFDIPVFIDCAYFGACKFDDLVINHSCIKFIAFSMSKAFSTGKCKIGLCFHNEKDSFMSLLNQYDYVNHVSLGIHDKIMDDFSPDYMYNTYRSKQLSLCKKFNFEPSDTVFLGYSYTTNIKGFDRDGTVSRFGIGFLLVDNYHGEVVWDPKN